MVLTGSVAGIGPVEPGETGDEEQVYRGATLDLTYADAKHEGEAEGPGRRRAPGGRGGQREPELRARPAGRPIVSAARPRRAPSPTTCAAACRRWWTARWTSSTCATWPRVTPPPPPTGDPGERYVLGGHGVRWVELVERVAELSDVHHPFLVIPPEMAGPARLAEQLGLPGLISSEALVLMGQNWRYSSAKARRELRFRARSLDSTLRDTIAWCRELIDNGALRSRPSPLSLAAGGVQLAGRDGDARRPAAGRAVDRPPVRLARLNDPLLRPRRVLHAAGAARGRAGARARRRAGGLRGGLRRRGGGGGAATSASCAATPPRTARSWPCARRRGRWAPGAWTTRCST